MHARRAEPAGELAIDPVEMRLRNHAEKNPATGQPFFNKRLRECYARVREAFGWDSPHSKRVGNHLIGHGMASSTHPAIQMDSSAQVSIFADSSAVVRNATHEIGNGAYTALGQIAADGFGLPVHQVRVELDNTNFPTALPAVGLDDHFLGWSRRAQCRTPRPGGTQRISHPGCRLAALRGRALCA